MATYQKIDNVNGPVYGSPSISNWEASSTISHGLSRGSISAMNPNYSRGFISDAEYVCNNLYNNRGQSECDGFFYIGGNNGGDQNYVNSSNGTNNHIYFYKYTGDNPNSCIFPSEFYSDSTPNDPLTGFYTKQIYHQNCRIERPEPSVSEQTPPVDCVLSDWSPWSACSATCGTGTQSRTRTILTEPANGGTACGDLSESQDCNTDPCPLNTDCIGSWSTCTADCIDKIYTVTTPQSGTGTECEAADGATEACLPGDGECPINCTYTEPDPSDCTECGVEIQGSATSIPSERVSECNDIPRYTCAAGDGECPQNIACEGTWSECTAACETASQRTFTETRAQSGTGAACPEAVDCNPGDGGCPLNTNCVGSWSTCTADCSDKRYTVTTPQSGQGRACESADGATRPCAAGEGDCPAESNSNSNSNSPIHCVLSEWSPWSECEGPCDSIGIQTKTRTVVTPAQNGGNPCDRQRESQRSCNTAPCPVDCVMSPWSPWSDCTESCGAGTQNRRRHVETGPEHGGSPCETNIEETIPCTGNECPVDCELSSGWSKWSDCSSFWSGTKTRNKRIITAPQNGGTPCGNLSESKNCKGFGYVILGIISLIFIAIGVIAYKKKNSLN